MHKLFRLYHVQLAIDDLDAQTLKNHKKSCDDVMTTFHNSQEVANI